MISVSAYKLYVRKKIGRIISLKNDAVNTQLQLVKDLGSVLVAKQKKIIRKNTIFAGAEPLLEEK